MKNKTITVYELIGFIKDDKAPMTIYYGGNKYCRTDNNYRHEEITDDGDEDWNLFDSTSLDSFFLDDTVEILPEEKEWEDIEECSRKAFLDLSSDEKSLELYCYVRNLIKNQKYLKEKLESKDGKD